MISINLLLRGLDLEHLVPTWKTYAYGNNQRP